MNVSLTPELESFVAEKLRSGLYSSQSEVVREGLRLLIERDRATQVRLDQLRAEVAEGLAQARRGELVPGDVARERLRQRRREQPR